MKNKQSTKHPLILGTCAKGSEEGTGYTIFKNTNEEMVKKIKALNKPSDTWEEKGGFMSSGASGKSKIDKKLNDKQFLCVDENGHYFIKAADSFTSTNRRDLIQKINEEFNAADVLNECAGPLHDSSGYGVVTFERYDTYYKRKWDDYDEDKMKSHMGAYDSHGRVSSSITGAYIDTYGGIFVSEGEIGGSSLFCHINEDGNIVNRDYNDDIKNYLGNEPKTRQDLIDEVILNIPDVKYQNYGNKWFSKNFAFILEKVEEDEERKETGGSRRGMAVLNLRRLESNGNGKYGDRHRGKANMPKSVVDVRRDHLLAQIIPILNGMDFGTEVDINSYIDMRVIDGIKEAKQTPKKRVQKTKIDENQYDDPYDWTTEESRDDYFYEDNLKDWKKLDKALEDFSNGIEVGDNEDTILEFTESFLSNADLPSFSFEKGEEQPDNDDFAGLVKYPHGVNLSFNVAEGDACEITWAHSIYYTDVVNLKIIE